jgi:hypothetical protein
MHWVAAWLLLRVYECRWDELRQAIASHLDDPGGMVDQVVVGSAE